MITFNGPNGEIYLNTTSMHLGLDGNSKISDNVKNALYTIGNYPNNRPLKNSVYNAIDLILDSEVCLSPSFFTNSNQRTIHRNIAIYVVNRSSFAKSLYDELKSVGALLFIDNLDGEILKHTMGHVMRLLAPWALSAFGNKNLSDVPHEFVHALVDFYRISDGRTWNEEAFGKSEVIRQCARNIILGLAKVFDDKTLIEKANSNINDDTRSKTWNELEGSTDPLIEEILRRRRVHLLTDSMRPVHVRQAAMDLIHWLHKIFPGMSLTEIFQVKDRPETFSRFLELRKGRVEHHHVARTARAKRLLDAFAEQIIDENQLPVLNPLITDREIIKQRSDAPTVGRPTTARARPLPEKLFALAKLILDEGQNGWLGKSGYFSVKTKINGKLRSVYCPVIPTLLRSAFDIPLRIVQWRRLDSGEGDNQRYNAPTKKWEISDNPLAGYWARNENKSPANYQTRGYAYRFPEEEGDLTGFFVNTNKTGQPYTIPWQHHQLHCRLWELRKWQEENNPIEFPLTPDQYLDEDMPLVTKSAMPDIFPLFRLFPSKTRPFPGRIPTPSEMDHAWQALMAELERRWNKENSDEKIQIVQRQQTTGQPQQSIYSLHGLRVRGITDLHRSGIPLEIISKMIVGHATVWMTIYYVNRDPLSVHEALEDSVIETRSRVQREIINNFKQWDVEQARQRTISLTDAALEEAVHSPSKVEYCNVDIGFCPFDCTRCFDGGPKIRSQKNQVGPDKDLYGPVPGGARNCIMCRHFITGPEWLNQLEWFGSKMCEKRRYLAQKEKVIVEKVENLELLLKRDSIGKSTYRQSLDALQSELLPLKDEQEVTESSIFNTEFFLEACVKIIAADEDGKGGNFVSASRDSVVQYIETTEFDSASMLTAQSRVYPILHDERVEAYRDRHLNRVLFNSDITPPDLAIEVSEEQRKASLDLFSNFLLERASREQRAKLTSGAMSLQEIGYREEVRELVASVIGKSTLSQPTSLLLDALDTTE